MRRARVAAAAAQSRHHRRRGPRLPLPPGEPGVSPAPRSASRAAASGRRRQRVAAGCRLAPTSAFWESTRPSVAIAAMPLVRSGPDARYHAIARASRLIRSRQATAAERRVGRSNPPIGGLLRWLPCTNSGDAIVGADVTAIVTEQKPPLLAASLPVVGPMREPATTRSGRPRRSESGERGAVCRLAIPLLDGATCDSSSVRSACGAELARWQHVRRLPDRSR